MSKKTNTQLAPDWLPFGRGTSVDFVATNREIQTALEASLPLGPENYRLLAIGQQESAPRRFREIVSTFQINEFESARTSGFWDFRIRSLRIPERIQFRSEVQDSIIYSMNGMILLQCYRNSEGPFGVHASFAICRRVARPDGSEVISHDEYFAVFSALKKYVKRNFRAQGTVKRVTTGEMD